MIKNLVIGGCVYNDEHRFLKEWLENLSKLNCKIFIIEDGSSDNSLSICEKYTSYILQTNRLYPQGENLIRKLWWDEASKLINNGDYLFPLDTDEFLTENSIIHFEEELYNCEKNDCDAITVDNYDMWNENEYRDEPEKGWIHSTKPLVNCIKFNKNKQYLWYQMYLHCGSIPANAYCCAYPSKLQIKHYGFYTPQLREDKVKFYEKYDPYDIIGAKNKQYATILDDNPKLFPFVDNYTKTDFPKGNRWPNYIL